MKGIAVEKIQPGRNHLIDLLRILAACGVVLFHFNEPVPYVHNFYRAFCKLGFLGVPIFFVISGYCIKIAESHSKTAKAFIIRRLFRILPPYWFSLLLVIASAIALKVITGTNSIPVSKNIANACATFFLYTYPLSHFTTINWVYWTLPFELFFYFLIALSMLLPAKLKNILLVIVTAIPIILPQQAENPFFFFNELPLFMLGYSLHPLLNKGNVYIGTIIFLLAITGIYVKHPGLQYLPLSLFVCLLIFTDSLKPLKNNFLSHLGDYSYSLYLIHVPIGIGLLGFIKHIKVVQLNIVLNIMEDLGLLILLILISSFTFKWIELKSIQMGKRFSK